ncbi:MAG: hypothetical protein LBG12_08100 [Synergistaceae bacterium]|jgi:hypothetical protein|nr:hypothetical protein [Synergistaceae bacterium]
MDDGGFQRKLTDLEARERELEKREKAARARGLCRNLYDRLDISIEKLDLVIVIVSLSTAALIVIGILSRPRV